MFSLFLMLLVCASNSYCEFNLKNAWVIFPNICTRNHTVAFKNMHEKIDIFSCIFSQRGGFLFQMIFWLNIFWSCILYKIALVNPALEMSQLDDRGRWKQGWLHVLSWCCKPVVKYSCIISQQLTMQYFHLFTIKTNLVSKP